MDKIKPTSDISSEQPTDYVKGTLKSDPTAEIPKGVAPAPKIAIKGDTTKAQKEDTDRLRKLAGIQEKGSATNPSTDSKLDDLSQSNDWPNSGPDMSYDDAIQRKAGDGKSPEMRGSLGLTIDADGNIKSKTKYGKSAKLRKTGHGKANPPHSTDTSGHKPNDLDLSAEVTF